MKTKLFGFPLEIKGSFFVVCLLLSVGQSDPTAIACWCVVCFLSVLFHELGHAVVARRFGYRAWIELHGMGGTTYHTRDDQTAATWRSQVAISLAGPAFGLLLGATVWLIARTCTLTPLLALFVRDMLWANIVWSLWNLVPILPYDGGHALEAVVLRISPRHGFAIVRWVGVVLALAGLVAALAFRQWWIGFLYARAIGSSWSALRERRHERGVDRAWELWDAGDLATARRELETLFAKGPSDRARASVVEIEVLVALRSLQADEAREALARYPTTHMPSDVLAAVVEHDVGNVALAKELLGRVSPDVLERVLVPLLVDWAASTDEWALRARDWTAMPLPQAVADHLGEKLFYAGHYDLSSAVHERAFEAFGVANDAYNAACGYAKAGQPSLAITWLARAFDAGYTDIDFLDRDPDLAALRELPELEALRATATAKVASVVST